MVEERRANRLQEESSPYLRQHAHNPVDWFPWGDEALALARREDRPILLSIGYSACHWCHVMERESFEDEAIARIMNENFVNIKVDREERPDLDEIYMTAVQAMTGSGGWPMTVFLKPDLQPFYGGTYFPPEDRYGRPGFPRVLQALARHYREERDRVEESAGQLMGALRQNVEFLRPQESLGEDILENAYRQLRDSFDEGHGGFGSAPKFPSSMSLSLLLRYYRRSGRKEARDMALLTLRKMANGGMYDQLGGGFHRYSVDERWLVPHFEKMLYDNGLLVWVYLEAFQLTGDDFYRRVARETLDYVRREMTGPEGGFYATQDADSEGEEGKYFTWKPEEIEALLGEEEGRLFARYFDVTPGGNFEAGQSILHVDTEIEEMARLLGEEEEHLRGVIQRGRGKLLEVHTRRIPPGTDEKILVAWNGLMISAMARAYQILGEDAYLEAGAKAADFILEKMVVDGRLMHTSKDGQARIPAYQDDYACLINSLLDLYEASLDLRWLRVARQLNREMMDLFWDDREGGFFFTKEGEAELIVRTKNPFDNAVPSGNSVAALVLLRMAGMGGEAELRERAEQTFLLFGELMQRSPSGCAQMLCALDFFEDQTLEVAVIGSSEERGDLLRALHRHFLPNKVVVGGDPVLHPDRLEEDVPLLKGKLGPVKGTARAYVCRDFVCLQPVEDADGLNGLLAVEP